MVVLSDDVSLGVPEDGWEDVLPGLGQTHGITVLERGRR
jgi:hypothetical protein